MEEGAETLALTIVTVIFHGIMANVIQVQTSVLIVKRIATALNSQMLA